MANGGVALLTSMLPQPGGRAVGVAGSS